jgi:hypothetical protein
MPTFKTFALRIALAVAATGVVAGQTLAQKPPELDVPAVVPPGAPPAPDPFNPREGAPAAANCAPTGLFSATVRNISPGLAASDPRAQPRQLWRQGSQYLRSVEQPLPNGAQSVVVIAEPHVWAYNEATRSGRHTIDPGPVLEVRAPILPPALGLPPELLRLEFGCEPDFVAAHAATPQQVINWGGEKAGVRVYTSGEHSVAILMDSRRSQPLMLSYLRQGRPMFVLRYDAYRRGLPERPELFQPPKSVKFAEGSAEAPPRPLD